MRPGIIITLLAIFLTTCNATFVTETFVLGPVLHLTETGTLRVVWWTSQPGEAYVRLETSTPITVSATTTEWHVTASPPLHRAWQHVADLPTLPPGQTLTYRLLLQGEEANTSRPFTLRSPPAAPPLRIAVIGDYGASTPWENDIHDIIATHMPDLLLTAGDNAYNSGSYDEFRLRVFDVYEDLMAQIPFMPAIGNHDNYTQHARPYLDLFVLPDNAWRESEKERYYSFDIANAHIVVLDSTDALDAISDEELDDMADWLAHDLSHTTKPWRVAVFHHPPYSAGAHGSDLRVRQRLVPILEAGGVQFVFNGHEHDYQRTCPIREETCTTPETGVTYVVTGGGGAWLRATGQDWFTAKAESVHEAAFLTLGRCSAQLRVLDRGGHTVDTFTVTRPRCQSVYLAWLSYHLPKGISDR